MLPLFLLFVAYKVYKLCSLQTILTLNIIFPLYSLGLFPLRILLAIDNSLLAFFEMLT